MGLYLFLVLKNPAKILTFPKANWWYYPPVYDHDKLCADFLADPSAPFPVTYVSFPSAKDPSWEDRYPGRSTVDVITLTKYDWFKEWDGTQWHKRGDGYEERKAAFTERLLENLFHLEPQLRGKVDHAELSTLSLSTKHFCNYAQGEIYGIEHTPKTGLKNGGSDPNTDQNSIYPADATAGVGGAMMGVFFCVVSVLGKNMIPKL